MTLINAHSRRSFLKTSAAGLAAGAFGCAGTAHAAEPINFATWSAGVDTVKGHIKHIMGKLGASDRTHAIAIAARRGFIHL